jgi:hypothetical protein
MTIKMRSMVKDITEVATCTVAKTKVCKKKKKKMQKITMLQMICL